eukprot:TRINITY_DN1103_c0_g3_i1.p1 TRINITY_DN1103_c0_g3~~TRINITY_DN1103_c0_g3_i1.p1  ORF type:complete len:425 (+),score=124.42 TRINITY_DN1103_c0_g3_i1:163-1437(+)
MSTIEVGASDVHSDTLHLKDDGDIAPVILRGVENVSVCDKEEPLRASHDEKIGGNTYNVSGFVEPVEGSDGETWTVDPTLGPCDSDLAVNIYEIGEKEVVEIEEGELVTESPTPAVDARSVFDELDGEEETVKEGESVVVAAVVPVPKEKRAGKGEERGLKRREEQKSGTVIVGGAAAAQHPKAAPPVHDILQEEFVIDVGTAKRACGNEVLDVAVLTYITTPPRRSKEEDSIESILPASKRTLATRVAVAFVIMMILGILVAYFFGGYVEIAARVFVGNFGLYGIFFAMLIMDSIPFSPTEACLMMGLAFGINIWLLMIVASIGSVLAGPLSWLIGLTILAKSPRFLLMLQRNRVTPVLEKHTVGCVSLAAVLPVWDYTVTNYCAGAIKTKVFDVFKGSLWRIPRVFLTVLILYVGWEFARGE